MTDLKNHLRLRLFQMDIRPSIEENLKAVNEAVEKGWSRSGSKKVRKSRSDFRFDILLLPELFTTGYHSKSRMLELAEEIEGPTVRFLRDLCRKHCIALGAGSIAEKDGHSMYNTSVTIDPEGKIISTYRKTHLFGVMNEDTIFEPGSEVKTFDLFGIRMGTITCYEIRFPELSRKLTLSGARIIFCPAEWPNPRKEIVTALGLARAIENQLFFGVINRAGSQNGYDFCGSSHVVEPNGTFIGIAGEGEEIIDVELDLSLIDKARENIPALKDRRPELY